jgi:uncharacterized protein with von Willebrand factor type A (vWA) domain
MGLVFNTSKWADGLWKGHVDRFSSASRLLEDGGGKRSDFSKFAEDLHSRLYLHNEPEKIADSPDWATKLHNAASELSEWQQLRSRCQADGFAAGIATESVLQALLPMVQAEQEKDQQQQDQDGQPGGQPGGQQGGQGGQQGQGGGKPGKGAGGQPGKPGEGNGGDLRAALRKAAREASKAVDQAERALDGLDESLGFTRPGTGVGQGESMKDLNSVRSIYDTLLHSQGLRRVCEIAGRMIRSARNRKRTKVSGAVGAIKGLMVGGDIPRVLPSELAGLRGNKMQRLMALSKVLEKRALQYEMRGEATETRGPIVLLIDESGSMRESGGAKEIWAKALALALLTTATKQRRTMYLIGFNGGITRQARIEPGNVDFAKLAELLSYHSSGGTSFNVALRRAVEVVDTESGLKKADVVMVTDGEDEVGEEIQADLLRRREESGLQLYVIGVGYDAGLNALAGVATSVSRVTDTDSDDVIAPVINLEESAA